MAEVVAGSQAATTTRALQQSGCNSITPEQHAVINGLMQQRDVFAVHVLPGGCDKTTCYSSLSLLHKQMSSPEDFPIIIVICAHNNTVKTQVADLYSKGLKTCYITKGQNDEELKLGVTEGEYQIVYFSAEVFMRHKRWRKMLLTDVYVRNLKTIVIDETDTIKLWAENYQWELQRIGELRMLLPKSVNMLVLATTATTSLRIEMSYLFGLRNEIVLSLPPCRDNVMFVITSYSKLEDVLEPIAEKLKKEQTHFTRMLICCQTDEHCANSYLYFKHELGSGFLNPPNAPDLARFRLVDMYLSCTTVKKTIIERFTKESSLRVVIATKAFGLDIDCFGVQQIIHVGPPSDLESYIQETSRVGRDGVPSVALLCRHNKRKPLLDLNMIKYVSNEMACRRDVLFGLFDHYERRFSGDLCMCCDLCAKMCECNKCEDNHKKFVFF